MVPNLKSVPYSVLKCFICLTYVHKYVKSYKYIDKFV